jgi:hypothetical protein
MSDKTRRFLLIAYLLLCAVAIAIEQHISKREPISSPMDKILLAPLVWGFAVYGIQEGYVRGRLSRVERSYSPITFWINIAVYLLIGLVSFYWGVSDAFG